MDARAEGGDQVQARPDPSGTGLGELTVSAGSGGVVIDLSALRWCDPLHLAGTAALASRHGQGSGVVRVVGPADPEARSYAGRMRLGRILDGLGAAHDLPVAREHDRRADLLEVRPVRDEEDAIRLARLVARRARPEDRVASSTLFACVVEMALNVAEHSGVTGYVAAQTLPRQGWMRFAVADTGVGLRATLAAQGAADDRIAALLALSGTSRLPGAGRGTGLPTTRRELVRAGGWLLLASGTASVHAAAAGQAVHEVRPAFPGTLVHGALRIADRLDTGE